MSRTTWPSGYKFELNQYQLSESVVVKCINILNSHIYRNSKDNTLANHSESHSKPFVLTGKSDNESFLMVDSMRCFIASCLHNAVKTIYIELSEYGLDSYQSKRSNLVTKIFLWN